MLYTYSKSMATQPTDPLTPDEQTLLKLLARIVLTLPRDFSAELGKAAGVALSEYHVLMHLSEEPIAGVRMGDLAARTGLTLGAVTRLLRELEGKGLAERQRDAGDGRVQRAHLTTAGWARLEVAAPVHRDSARRHLLGRLTPAQTRVLVETLALVAEPAHDQEVERD